MTRRIPTIKKYFYALIFSDKWKDHWTMGVQWPYSVLFVTGGDNIAIFFSPHVLFASYFYLCLAIMVPGVSLYRWLDVRFKYRFKNVEETKECILSHQTSKTYLIEVHQIKLNNMACAPAHTYIHTWAFIIWQWDVGSLIWIWVYLRNFLNISVLYLQGPQNESCAFSNVMHTLYDVEISKLDHMNFMELWSVIDMLLKILTLYSSCKHER